MPQYSVSEWTGSEWVLKKTSDNLEDFDVQDRAWFDELLRTEGAEYIKIGWTMYEVFHDKYETISEMRAAVIRELSASKTDVV